MLHYFFILFVIVIVDSKNIDNSTSCNGFQANFIIEDVVGTWHVVAIIPENLFPEKDVTCYKMDISETDETGLRWLINKTNKSPKLVQTHDDNAITVRQRYYTETPFDVWSKSVHGVKGCFQQVISLDIRKKDIHKALKLDAMMQFHILEVEGNEPFLLQMLWGKMIAVVIYRKSQGVKQAELKPVFELMNRLRGPQRLPKICDSLLKDLLQF